MRFHQGSIWAALADQIQRADLDELLRFVWPLGNIIMIEDLQSPVALHGVAPAAGLPAAEFSSAADFTFAAVGDTPYSGDEEARFPDLIAAMNREPLAFVVHVGDFKSAISSSRSPALTSAPIVSSPLSPRLNLRTCSSISNLSALADAADMTPSPKPIYRGPDFAPAPAFSQREPPFCVAAICYLFFAPPFLAPPFFAPPFFAAAFFAPPFFAVAIACASPFL